VRCVARVEEVTDHPRPRSRTAVTSRPENLPRSVAAIVAAWRGVHVSRIRVDVTTGEVHLLRDRRRGGAIVSEEVLAARVVR